MVQLFQTLQPNVPGQTPSGTGLTDDQIAQLRQYASALQGGKQPVHHWLQGLSNMTGDIVSALQQRKANQIAQQRQNTGDAYIHQQTYGRQPQAQPPAYGAAPPAAAPQQAGTMPPYAAPNTDWQSAQPSPYSSSPFQVAPADAQGPMMGDFERDPSMMSTG
jgi:hypothetical protein